MGICVVWADAVLQIVLCGGVDLGGESGVEHDLAEIFPVWAARVGVEVVDVLESAAHAAPGAYCSLGNYGGTGLRGSSIQKLRQFLKDQKPLFIAGWHGWDEGPAPLKGFL